MLTSDIGLIFRVLPDGGDEAAREVLERWLVGGAAVSSIVTWAEFDQNGNLLRGGGTDMAELSTRLVSDLGQDRDLAELVAGFGAGIQTAGRIVPRRDGARLHWYMPHFPSSATGVRHGFRGLSIGESLLGDVIALFQTDAGITPAERRMLFQLLRGESPRSAAEEDGISMETKRAYIKSACAKLGCNGQTDLVRLLMGQLSHLLTIVATAESEDGAIERFVRDHLSPNVHLVLHRQADGRLLRTLQCGPVDGRPLIVAHGMLYPLLLLNCRQACERHGLRIIVPVRSGYLDDRSATALYERRLPERDMADLAYFIANLPGGQAVLAGHSLGTSWAIDFALLYPHLVSKLILISPHEARSRPSSSRFFGSFIDGLEALANKPSLYRYVAWQFRKRYADAGTVRRVLRRLFENSHEDIRVLDGDVGSGRAYDWFSAAYRSSIVGIAEDMTKGMQGADPVDLPTMPTTIIRGPDDPFAETYQRFAAAGGADVEILPAGGHLVAASHANDMWDRVAAALRHDGYAEIDSLAQS